MKRPRVIINVAASADGKIDSYLRQGTSISSLSDKERVDRLRADVDAILVGGHTLLAEDPKLTIKSMDLRKKRLEQGLSENPAKIGVVSEISLEEGVEVIQNFMSTGPAKKFIFTTSKTSAGILEKLKSADVTVYVDNDNRVDLPKLFQILEQHGIHSVMVEGGGTLISELVRLELVDLISIYIAPKILGGATSPTFADGKGFPPDSAPSLQLLSCEKIDDLGGVLLKYAVNKIYT